MNANQSDRDGSGCFVSVDKIVQCGFSMKDNMNIQYILCILYIYLYLVYILCVYIYIHISCIKCIIYVYIYIQLL